MKTVSFWEFASKRPSVVTIGSFDGVHVAHRRLIREVVSISERWKYEALLFTFKEHPHRKDEFLMTYEEKIAELSKFPLSRIVVMDERVFSIDARTFVEEHLKRRFNMDWLVIGYNHRFGNMRRGDAKLALELMHELDYSLTVIGAYKIEGIPVSSSNIRRFIKEGNIELANRMLSYRYFLHGKVIKGKGIGSRLGFPTANLQVDPSKLVPKEGVYAVVVHVEGKTFLGAMHVGRRKTLDGSFSLEVHILDFQGNLLGKDLKIEFLRYIRPIRKFANLEELRKRISQDIEEVKRYAPTGI